MLVDLNAPAAARGEVARRMKEAFDRLEYADAGWWYVDFDHPAFGREEAGTTADRVPGNVITTTQQPGEETDALIVAVGFEDPYTGEVHMGNLFTVPGVPERVRNPAGADGGSSSPSEWLPALALFEQDGRLYGLTGTIHTGRDSVFGHEGTWPELDAAIAEWAQLTAREVRAGAGR